MLNIFSYIAKEVIRANEVDGSETTAPATITTTTPLAPHDAAEDNEDEDDEEEDIGPAVKAFKFCLLCNVAYCRPCLAISHPDRMPFISHKMVTPRRKLIQHQDSNVVSVVVLGRIVEGRECGVVLNEIRKRDLEKK